uniref:SHSP domain-containing protein n=1 Tax=Percolomonas cosmopolitus TaxID=63605 RepID=A0A7S1PFY1_9EUKA
MSLSLRNINRIQDPFFDDAFDKLRFPSFGRSRFAPPCSSFPLMRGFGDSNSWFDDWSMSSEGFSSCLGDTDLKETDSDFQLALEAPGFNKHEISIDLNDNVLTIAGEKKQEENEAKEDGSFERRSFSSRKFSRSFTLPADKADLEKINAKLNNGVLHLSVPKLPELQHKPVKSIPIE